MPPCCGTSSRAVGSRTCAGRIFPTTRSLWTASMRRPVTRRPGSGKPAVRVGALHGSGLPGRLEEWTRARGLRRIPMGRPPPGLEGPERRSRALRRGAHGLRDASRVRSAHRADQPAALPLRSERRGEGIRPAALPPRATDDGRGRLRPAGRRRAFIRRLSTDRGGAGPLHGDGAGRCRGSATRPGEGHPTG